MTLVPMADVEHPSFSSVSLDDLAAIANQEHEATERALGDLRDVFAGAALHAIRVGEVLIEIRSRMASRTWNQWRTDNLKFSRSRAQSYMRIAGHRGEVEAWLEDGGNGTILSATKHLATFPALLVTDERREEAVRLKDDGLTGAEIARALKVRESTISYWTNPETRRKKVESERRRSAKRREASKALAEKRRDQAVRRRGGPAATLYGQLRRFQGHLHDLIASSSDAEERAALVDARAALYRAEDQLVKAMKLTGVERYREHVHGRATRA